MSALILASKKDSSEKEVGVAKGHVATPTKAHLERRVRTLEEALERKDEESARRLRSLQQKHEAMEVRT